MKINTISDDSFKKYGKVITGYDFSEMLEILDKETPTPEAPADSMNYVPHSELFEKLPAYEELRDNVYGGVPIETGYCCGRVDRLNALEYHRNSEVVITGNDQIIVVGSQQDIVDYTYDTSKAEAFFVPKGTCWELYATTLHYAPFTMEKGQIFKHVCVLIKGTNTEKPTIAIKTKEDELMAARNNWKLTHAESPEAADGGYVGLIGKNIDRDDVFSS